MLVTYVIKVVRTVPRPHKCRTICALPKAGGFEPIGKVCEHAVVMSLDEYEVIRLIDLEGLTQEQCAAQINVSRTTVTGIYESVRRKIADAIVNQKRLIIEGGNYRVCEGRGKGCGERACQRYICCKDSNNEIAE